MHRKQKIYTVVILFISLSLLLFVLSKSAIFSVVQGWGEAILIPAQRIAYNVLGYPFSLPADSRIRQLQEENALLAKQIIAQDKLKRETQALRDQFSSQELPTRQLLPAAVIGARTVLSGLGQPTELIIDKGKDEGIQKGTAVVYKDILVGSVTQVSTHISAVAVTTHKKTSLPARTVKTNALGVIRGQESSLLLDNVLLSDTLEQGDLVVTKGNIDNRGVGNPPDILIGKIVSVQKEPSALFQTAEVEPILNISRISTVFVITGM